MNAPFDGYALLEGEKAEEALGKIAAELKTGTVIPYIGPGLTQLSPTEAPMTPEALAAFFGTKVALPKRAKGNAWASAQHIENMKHRSTVSALMSQAFEGSIAPTPLHVYFASLQLPMIVDSWYDATMRSALEGRGDWGEIQGITRAGIGEDRWYRFYEADGTETTKEKAETWKTILYKPHGSIAPAKNFLISDADYVEVLTEIDIQTPLPEAVKNRRVRAQLSVRRLSLSRSAVAHLCPADHEALDDDASRDRRSGGADEKRAEVPHHSGNHSDCAAD